MASKPNPLAGFGRVGCGVFIGGQGADGHRARTISGFAVECKQQKNLGVDVGLDKKKKTDSAGKSAFF